ncbi:MAG: hypothetical protein O7C98_06580 [Planctomycetota bacterium]|nr:hypothetical protein [Planctomycetota bacterium]
MSWLARLPLAVFFFPSVLLVITALLIAWLVWQTAGRPVPKRVRVRPRRLTVGAFRGRRPRHSTSVWFEGW